MQKNGITPVLNEKLLYYVDDQNHNGENGENFGLKMKMGPVACTKKLYGFFFRKRRKFEGSCVINIFFHQISLKLYFSNDIFF